MGVTIGPDGEVGVLDTQNARVSWFDARDGVLTLVGDSRVVVGAFDFCLIGSEVLILAYPPEGHLPIAGVGVPR